MIVKSAFKNAAILTAATASLFGCTIFYPLLWWDDRQHICQNPFFHPPNLQTIWTHSYFGLYAPLSYSAWLIPFSLSRMIFDLNSDCLHWGMPFHVLNVLTHAANVLLVFFILRRIVPTAPFGALFGALLFCCHPMQVEARNLKMLWIDHQEAATS